MVSFDWTQMYWWLLFIGFGISILYLLLGDVLEGVIGGLDGWLNPLLLFSGIAIVGGAGVLLSKYSKLSELTVLISSILIGTIAYIGIYYFLILPLSKAEVSTTYSIKDLEGSIAEVITTIPSAGYGEIILTTISGTVNFTAKSFDGTEIKNGTRVVVVKAEPDHVIVTIFDDNKLEDARIEN